MLRTHPSISCQGTHEPTSEETHCYSFQLNARGDDLSNFSRFEGRICFRCSFEGSLVWWLMKSQSSKIPSWEILLGTMRLEQRNSNLAGGLNWWDPHLGVMVLDPDPESGSFIWVGDSRFSPGGGMGWGVCVSQDDDFINTAWWCVPQTAIERHMYNQTPSDKQIHLSSTLKKSRF